MDVSAGMVVLHDFSLVWWLPPFSLVPLFALVLDTLCHLF